MNDIFNGPLTAVPAGSANGTPISAKPATARAVIIYLGASDSISYTIANEQPTGAPSLVTTVTGAQFLRFSEPLGESSNIFVTAISGTPMFRFADIAAPLPMMPTGTSAQQVQGNVAADAVDSGNPAKIGGYATNDPAGAAVAVGDRVNAAFSRNGALYVATSYTTPADGVTNIGAQFLARDGQQYPLEVINKLFNGSSWDRDKKPNQNARLLSSAATTNGSLIKNSAGDLHRVFGRNTSASVVWLKLYNKASAPTVGTDSPAFTIPLPPTASFDFDFGANGHHFSAGIGWAFTGAAPDADTTAINAADIIGFNLSYTG